MIIYIHCMKNNKIQKKQRGRGPLFSFALKYDIGMGEIFTKYVSVLRRESVIRFHCLRGSTFNAREWSNSIPYLRVVQDRLEVKIIDLLMFSKGQWRPRVTYLTCNNTGSKSIQFVNITSLLCVCHYCTTMGGTVALNTLSSFVMHIRSKFLTSFSYMWTRKENGIIQQEFSAFFIWDIYNLERIRPVIVSHLDSFNSVWI